MKHSWNNLDSRRKDPAESNKQANQPGARQPVMLPPLTAHAQKRLQQRGVRPWALRLVLDFGRVYHAGRNCLAYHLGRRDVRNVQRRLGLDLHPLSDLALVLSDEGEVVTVMHVTAIPREWMAA